MLKDKENVQIENTRALELLETMRISALNVDIIKHGSVSYIFGSDYKLDVGLEYKIYDSEYYFTIDTSLLTDCKIKSDDSGNILLSLSILDKDKLSTVSEIITLYLVKQ